MSGGPLSREKPTEPMQDMNPVFAGGIQGDHVGGFRTLTLTLALPMEHVFHFEDDGAAEDAV